MSKYIKLEETIEAIEDKIAEYIPTLYGRYGEIPLELRMTITSLPTIEVSDKADRPSRAEGKWIEHKYAEEYDGLMQSNFECSKCRDWLREQTNYCPNCGAKMRLE